MHSLAAAITAAVLGSAVLGAQTSSPPPGTDYKAPDGSLALRVPAGWRASTADLGGVPVHVLQPSNGGEDRILIGLGPVTATSIQELAQQTVQVVTQQLLPGARVTAQPKYGDSSQGPTVELAYDLAGQSVWWQSVIMLKDKRYLTVLGGARRDRLTQLEQQSRTVLSSVRLLAATPSSTTDSAALGRLLIGHWTWYHRTDDGGGRTAGSTSREIWFYANGRYQYTATTYVPSMPTGVDPTTTVTGTYQVQGNRISARADNGQVQTFTIEVVQGGKGIKIDGELYIRE